MSRGNDAGIEGTHFARTQPSYFAFGSLVHPSCCVLQRFPAGCGVPEPSRKIGLRPKPKFYCSRSCQSERIALTFHLAGLTRRIWRAPTGSRAARWRCSTPPATPPSSHPSGDAGAAAQTHLRARGHQTDKSRIVRSIASTMASVFALSIRPKRVRSVLLTKIQARSFTPSLSKGRLQSDGSGRVEFLFAHQGYDFFAILPRNLEPEAHHHCVYWILHLQQLHGWIPVPQHQVRGVRLGTAGRAGVRAHRVSVRDDHLLWAWHQAGRLSWRCLSLFLLCLVGI